MIDRVYVHVTCRKLTLLPASLLVFKTLRVGFPSAEVRVYLGDIVPHSQGPIVAAVDNAEAKIINGECGVGHDCFIENQWIEEEEPFVVCDTDMVFFESVEEWEFKEGLAGAFEPSHQNPVTGATHLPRLHTSLLFVNPAQLALELEIWRGTKRDLPFDVRGATFRQQWLPIEGRTLFADTGALMYGAVRGQKFTEAQRAAYAHLNCGTWLDIAGRHVPGLAEAHAAVFENPQAARGMHLAQDQWYREHGASIP